MNSAKKNVLLTAAITLLLVIGTAIIPIQSYASEEHKKYGDSKSSINSDTYENKKGASQHQDQDNFCYRGDECEQANQGQQVIGKDNDAKGFNDQSRNIQQQALNPTATPTQPPTQPPTPTPTTTTLNVCKEVVILGSTSFEPSDFIFEFTTPAVPSSFLGANEGCTAVTVAPGTYSFTETFPPGNPASIGVEGGCAFDSTVEQGTFRFVGTIAAGETQTCTITNTIF